MTANHNQPQGQATEQTPQPSDLVANTSIAMWSKVVYLVSRLAIPPIVLSYISLAEYGLWTSCFILIMYVGLTDAGFSNVYVRYTAQYHAKGDQQAINRLLSTGMLLLSGLALGVFTLVAICLPWLLEYLKIDAVMHHEATILILAVVALFLLDMTLGAYCYLLHGLQRIREEQRIVMRGYLIELALIVLLLAAGLGIYALLVAFAVRYLTCLYSYRRVAHQVLPGLRLSPSYFDRHYVSLFFGFGAKVQASALVATILSTLDRILASLVGGTSAIALFDLGNKLPMSAMIIPSTLTNLALAQAAHLDAHQRTSDIVVLLSNTTRAIALLSAIPLSFIAIFATPITTTWLGSQTAFDAIPTLMFFAALTQHVHIVTGPSSSIMRATGQISFEFVYHVLRLILIAVAVLIMRQLVPDPILSLAYGLFAGGTLAAAGYLFLAYRKMDASLTHLMTRSILPAALPYAVAAVLIVVWNNLDIFDLNRWWQLTVLGIFGTIYLLGTALAIWHLTLNHQERHVLSARLHLPSLAFLRNRTS